MEKELLQTQISFFLGKEFNAFEGMSLELKKQLGETESQYLPVPADAPIEIPRLMINYSEYNFRIFKNRIDITFLNNFDKEILVKVINVVSSILGLNIARIGFVKTYFLNSDLKLIKDLFVPEKISSLDIKGISLTLNTNYLFKGISCNNIQKMDHGTVVQSDGITQKSGLVILRDCNTFQEQFIPSEWTEANLIELISAFDSQVTKLLVL